ncbi:MAG: T9SS type A sorting domain-containing protein [bacterium]
MIRLQDKKGVLLTLIILSVFPTTSYADNVFWQVVDQGGGIRVSGGDKLVDSSGQGCIGECKNSFYSLSMGYILPITNENAITFLTHSGTTSLGIGKVLEVVMNGTPYGFATFVISGMATTTMTEIQPGTYTGTYTVKNGDNIINGTLTGYLTIGTNTYTKICDVPVTLDGILPASYPLSLSEYSNTSSLKIPYLAFDKSGLKQINLYKMKEGGTWDYHTYQPISGILTTGTFTCNLGTNTDGKWFFYTKAKDMAGNEELFTGTTTSTIVDTTKPMVEITNINDGTIPYTTPATATIIVAFIWTEKNPATFTIVLARDGHIFASNTTTIFGLNNGTISLSYCGLSDGTYTLYGTLTDKALNYGTFSVVEAIIVHTLPTITKLRIVPSSKVIHRGTESTVDVLIEDVTNMAGAELFLSFNPDILEVSTITSGEFPQGGMVVQRYDNSTGSIYYFVGLIGSATGSGVLCSIRFRGEDEGTSSLCFGTSTTLRDASSNAIPFNKEDGIIYVTGTPTTILYVCGNNQRANCEETLPNPFVIKVEDIYHNPYPDVLINWEITDSPDGASGFNLSQTQTLTNINGTTGAYLILGKEPPGTYTVEARLSDSLVVFNAYSLRRFGNISGLCFIDFGTAGQRVGSISVRLIETGATTTTTPDSRFIFDHIQVGTYSLAFTYPGATPATKTDVIITKTQFNETTEQGTIILILGDANGDGQINISDWPALADTLGSKTYYNSNCDFNADAIINIDDFMIFRANFGEQQTLEGIKPLKAKREGGKITLKFEPESINNVKIGEIIEFNILISGARDSLCGEIHLSYDENILKPIGKIVEGDWLPENAYRIINRVENGRIDYAYGLVNPQEMDSGVLGKVRFMVKDSGSSQLNFNFDMEENRETMFIERIGNQDSLLEINSQPAKIDVPVIFNSVYCFPNPARKVNKVTFKNISKDTNITLKVFNIAGELLYEGEKRTNSSGEFEYEMKNKDGKDLPSGVYIFVVDDGKDKKKGKVGIIR